MNQSVFYINFVVTYTLFIIVDFKNNKVEFSKVKKKPVPLPLQNVKLTTFLTLQICSASPQRKEREGW